MPKQVTLKNPSVQAVKRRYETYWVTNRKIALSFNQLFQRYSNPCISFVAIAKESESINPENKVSREAIRTNYQTWFAQFFPRNHRQFRGRGKVCTLHRHELSKNAFSGNSPAATLARRAKLAGLKPEGILQKSGNKPFKALLYINGRLCSVHVCQHSSKIEDRGERKYYRPRIRPISRRGIAFICCLTVTSSGIDVYIVPKSKLTARGKEKVHYIPDPETPSLRPKLKGRINWETHRNNWAVLNKKDAN